MQQDHESHGQMPQQGTQPMPQHMPQQMPHQAMRKHYVMLGVSFLGMLVLMYLIMFSMIWSGAQFVQNINFFYMAVMMATPMVPMMPLMMPSMYSDRRWNGVVYVGSIVLFILAFAGIRGQTLVGDKQFVRSMIPHHSGALLMCNRSSLRDAEVRELCFRPGGIVESQTAEIAKMKGILGRM